MLTTATRLRIEGMIKKLATGEEVTLKERIELHKYAKRYPMIAGKLSKVLN